uniref:EMAP like 3 n=1 Tax=Sinocyclocheilus grahami TaxID=75366 RepID=A0A672R1P6_SINGR
MDIHVFLCDLYIYFFFFLDDVSAESSTEFPDRLSLMEVRLQAQEDEITLLKSSLADALRKLRLHDQQIPLLKQQVSPWRMHYQKASRSLMKPLSSSAERRKLPMKSRGGRTKPGSIKMFIRGRPITMYIPSNILNYEELRMDLPSQKLDLDWVYGYRGRDCRANLYLLPSGEAVYFIACVVVLYHINNQTQRHYQKHTDCVRCLAIHPDKVRVASGQTAGVDKDGKPLQPFVHIWDSKTLVTLQQVGLGTFERGVGALAFSSSDAGTFLCVIDDSNEHMLSVWDWNKNIKHVEVKSTNEAVLAVDFSPTDTNNIISCGKSHVYFWTMSAGTLTKKQGIFGKYKKPKFVLCFVFSLTGDVLTGDSEGNILTWGKSAADTKTLGKGAKETFQIMKQTRAHEGSVFTLCILQGGAILSGGGKDRKVIRWSADLAPERECEIPEKFGAVRTIADVDGEELLVGTTRNAILRGSFSDGFVGHVDEMWGLATHPTQNIFLTCGNDRQVCVWNAEDHKLDWCTTLEESGLCADFSPNGGVVSVGLSTGRWVVLDLQTKEVVTDLTDGNEQLSVMRYSPDGSFLAVGSHDNFIYIYNVTEGGRRYTRFGKCTGHSSFITHLDWSKDGKYIMSNSGDYEILYWDVASGCKLLRNRFESKDREWASYTCVLGFHVMGERKSFFFYDFRYKWFLLRKQHNEPYLGCARARVCVKQSGGEEEEDEAGSGGWEEEWSESARKRETGWLSRARVNVWKGLQWEFYRSAETKTRFFYHPEKHCSGNFKLLPARAAAPCRVPALSRSGGKYASTREDIKNQQHFWIRIVIHTTRETVIFVFV